VLSKSPRLTSIAEINPGDPGFGNIPVVYIPQACADLEGLDNRAFRAFLEFFEIGAGDKIRTHDFNLGKVALYPG
jgi:hypothetical protein